MEMADSRGYEIRTFETLGTGKGEYFEVWKDGILWGFAKRIEDAEQMIKDNIAEK